MGEQLGKYQRLWHLEVRAGKPKSNFDRQWQATGSDWGFTRSELLKQAKESNKLSRGHLIYRVRRYRAEKP